MLPLLVFAVIIATETEQQNALDRAYQITAVSHANECFAKATFRAIRYTTEPIASALDYAAAACGSDISVAAGSISAANLMGEQLRHIYRKEAMDWRIRAGQFGAAAYSQIQDEIDSKFCALNCRTNGKSDPPPK